MCLTHQRTRLNGVTLHYVEAGAGPVVVLLHGFPEFWYAWRHQIPALAQAGFHVVAPDLRGYNESGKPAGVRHYRVELVTADVLTLIRHAGASRARVVGHDWGGVIAWELAMHHPEAVEQLAILNAPHPAAYLRELRNPSQLLRSWYVFFFQLPWFPEVISRAGDYAFLERALRHDPVRPDAFTSQDIRRYKQALARPQALTCAINYYRAALRRLHRTAAVSPPIAAPTLLLWGQRDRYLTTRLTEGLETWVPCLQVQRFPNASHWLQNDAPDEVNRSLVRFFRPED